MGSISLEEFEEREFTRLMDFIQWTFGTNGWDTLP
jgi:hypothetical protein